MLHLLCLPGLTNTSNPKYCLTLSSLPLWWHLPKEGPADYICPSCLMGQTHWQVSTSPFGSPGPPAGLRPARWWWDTPVLKILRVRRNLAELRLLWLWASCVKYHKRGYLHPKEEAWGERKQLPRQQWMRGQELGCRLLRRLWAKHRGLTLTPAGQTPDLHRLLLGHIFMLLCFKKIKKKPTCTNLLSEEVNMTQRNHL